MANPTELIKRVPKWAWFVAAGVTVGGVALRKRQADKEEVEAAVTGSDPATGQPTGTAPPGVIVPPVIMSSGGDGGSAQIDPSVPAIYAGLNDVFAGGFTNVLETASRLSWNPDQIIALYAGAGGSPNPASQEPPVVNVTIAAPAPAPAPVPTSSTGSGCPPAFPRGSKATGCYNACGHDECKNHILYRISGHCYEKTGMKVMSRTSTGKKC